jgi:hypothetical protein
LVSDNAESGSPWPVKKVSGVSAAGSLGFFPSRAGLPALAGQSVFSKEVTLQKRIPACQA